MQEKFNSEFDAKDDYEDEKRRNKQRLVRNEFEGVGKYGIPLIKKQKIDLDKIQLLNYTKTKANDDENKCKTIHYLKKWREI